jgi:hypothetical protein
VIRLNRFVAAFLGNRVVVRGSISAAMVLSLILFAVICFLWMVGTQPDLHGWIWIVKGYFSYGHISTGHALHTSSTEWKDEVNTRP